MYNPILLLHGIPVTSAIWAGVTPALDAYGTVLAPDLLGLGAAPQPDIAYGPADYFAWLEEVLVGVTEPITLVLHDFGGPVGLNWAVQRSERVRRLVLMNTTVYPAASGWGALSKIPGLIPFLSGLMLSGPLFGWQMRHMFAVSDERLIHANRALYTRPPDRRTVKRIARAWTQEALMGIAAQLPRLSCPVLLAWGMGDRYIFPWRPHGERFASDLQVERIAHIEGAGHFLQAEQPEALLRYLLPFISQ